MGAALVPIVIVLVVVLALVAVIRTRTRQTEQALEHAHDDSDALHYRVAPEQDPVAVVAALHAHGLGAVSEGEFVIVSSESATAPDRDHVRRVIADASLNLEGDEAPARPVRFVDES